MKFLVDENLPPRLAAWLRDRGHDAVHAKDLGLLGRSDADIADAARAGSFTIITQDADFDAAPSLSTVRLAFGNLSTAILLLKLEPLLEQALKRLRDGALFVLLE
jgi:predicted nuclease of predicted toxin-antitoxin system